MGALTDLVFGGAGAGVQHIGQAFRMGIDVETTVPISERRRARHEVRLAAYSRFQRTVLDMAMASQLVRSMVPGFKGSLWTIPAHFRRLRRLDEVSRELLLSFADVNLVRSEKARDLAREVVDAVSDLATVAAPLKRADVEPLKREMQPVLEAIGDRLKESRLEARRDLAYAKPRWLWWMLPWKWWSTSHELATTTRLELPAKPD